MAELLTKIGIVLAVVIALWLFMKAIKLIWKVIFFIGIVIVIGFFYSNIKDFFLNLF